MIDCPGMKRDGATFVRALGAERVELIFRLDNDHALAADRHDDELILLQFGGFIARQIASGQWHQSAAAA